MINFLALIVLLVLAIAVLGAVLPAGSAASRADYKRQRAAPRVVHREATIAEMRAAADRYGY